MGSSCGRSDGDNQAQPVVRGFLNVLLARSPRWAVSSRGAGRLEQSRASSGSSVTHQTVNFPEHRLDTLAAAPLSGRKLAFVVTEDWFFASHFLPMARAAREIGLEVAVVTRVRAHRAAIEATGAQVIPLEAERRSLNPMAAGYAAGQLAADPQGVNEPTSCIASRCADPDRRRRGRDGGHRPRRVFALTGLGFLGARQDLVGRARAARDPRFWSAALETRQTRYLFENTDDPALLGPRSRRRPRVTIVGGAGVDAAAFAPSRCRRSRRCRSRWSPGCCGRRASTSRSRRAARGTAQGGRRTVALWRTRPVEPQGDPGGSAASLERRAGSDLARPHRRRRRRLARPSRLLPALARRRGAAAHPARSGGLRARHRHHATCPAAGRSCATGSKGFSCRRAMPQRSPAAFVALAADSRPRRPHGRGRPRPRARRLHRARRDGDGQARLCRDAAAPP